ncbi:hypothetical protein F5141DRAFT_560834 [Pisolithus sp. B1]|nr:hypothetical protein F5141DRAFT_560834 [Pisolithus sp. B1]
MREIFWWGSRRQEREHETPFAPVDPFSRRLPILPIYNSPDTERDAPLTDPVPREDSLFLYFSRSSLKDCIRSLAQCAGDFLTNTLLRQAYLLLLLGLPCSYSSTIASLFKDANVSPLDVDGSLQAGNCTRDRHARMSPILGTNSVRDHDHGLSLSEDRTTTNGGPALVRFGRLWMLFIDSLLREWETLNIVSALLLSAVLSMFQNQEMAYDPVVRTLALASLACALMSLVYGCIYIIQSTMMKSMYKATRWAQETQTTTIFTLWNVGIMLALPGVWSAWSMIFFITSILAFVWRSGSTTDLSTPSALSPNAAIGPRVLVSALFILGFAYLVAIMKTFQEYGRVNGMTGGTQIARETRDVIGEGRDRRDGEWERDKACRGRRKRKPGDGAEGGGTANDREKDWNRTCKDDGHETELEPSPHTYNHDRDDRGSSSLDAVTALGLVGLDGVASLHASDE